LRRGVAGLVLADAKALVVGAVSAGLALFKAVGTGLGWAEKTRLQADAAAGEVRQGKAVAGGVALGTAGLSKQTVAKARQTGGGKAARQGTASLGIGGLAGHRADALASKIS
jgi:hypothetical protein